MARMLYESDNGETANETDNDYDTCIHFSIGTEMNGQIRHISSVSVCINNTLYWCGKMSPTTGNSAYTEFTAGSRFSLNQDDYKIGRAHV